MLMFNKSCVYKIIAELLNNIGGYFVQNTDLLYNFRINMP
jgi:hypothetical protein